MNRYLVYTLIVFTALLFISNVIADEKNEYTLPSFQKEVNEFKSNRKGKSMDEADKSIMVAAARDLDMAMPSPGLRAGDGAPDFTLFNAFGRRVTLSDELKKGPVVLAFYRGAWCPFCNIELNVLQGSLAHFKEYNASLIAVTPQTPDKSKEQIKRSEYTFEVLSDLDNSVMKAYNLYFEVPQELHELYRNRFGFDITDYNGKDRLGLPVPGTFVIGQDGIILSAYAKTDYKMRMEPEDILEVLKSVR
jgi:peroxiredoxin